jgi:hypothetical protein
VASEGRQRAAQAIPQNVMSLSSIERL